MLIQNGDGTYTGGALDVILVLRNTRTQRLHVALYVERPFPGGADKRPTVVRLALKLSHTEGAKTAEELERHLQDFSAKITIPEANVWRQPERYQDFNETPPLILLVKNWTPVKRTDHAVPSQQCPECNFELDCASAYNNQGAPKPGDFTVCVRCMAVLRYTEQLTVRTTSLAERNELGPELETFVRSLQMVHLSRPDLKWDDKK